MEATQEMKDWFDKRQQRHIALVQQCAREIEASNPSKYAGLTDQTAKHDASKFEDPERGPFELIAWQYHERDAGRKFDVPKEDADRMNQATEHHVKVNSHHPEFHTSETVGLINREDRDKPPAKLIDATKMGTLDLAEMVSDWGAMGREKGTSPKDWADKNVGPRWKFTPEQVKEIYGLIELVMNKPLGKVMEMGRFMKFAQVR